MFTFNEKDLGNAHRNSLGSLGARSKERRRSSLHLGGCLEAV